VVDEFAFWDGAPLENIVSAREDKELGGNWSIDISLVYNTAPSGMSVEDEVVINHDAVADSSFFITNMGERREWEEKFLDLTISNNVFRLEGEVIKEEYTYFGNIVEQVERMLEYQEGESFQVEVEPSMSQSDIDEFLDITSELELGPEKMYRGFKYILRQYYARFRGEGNVIYLMPETHLKSTTLSFEYGLNNEDISREYDYERVVGTLVAEAWLRGAVVDGVIDPTVIKEYGSGTPVRYKDFGTFSHEGALDKVANEYLSEHITPEAEYTMSALDLLRMNEEDRPDYPAVELDVGQGVGVVDDELGIDNTLKVQRISRSLIEPSELMSLTVGEIREGHLQEFKDEVISTKKEQERRQPRLYTSTDPTHEPDPEKGKDGDVFVRPEGGDL